MSFALPQAVIHPLMHPVLDAGRGLVCLNDAQGYANPGATMLDRLGSRDPTNWDATIRSGSPFRRVSID